MSDECIVPIDISKLSKDTLLAIGKDIFGEDSISYKKLLFEKIYEEKE